MEDGRNGHEYGSAKKLDLSNPTQFLKTYLISMYGDIECNQCDVDKQTVRVVGAIWLN